jgi:VanZ family protein
MFKIILRVLPILYMAAIWFMSSNPADAIVELPRGDRFIKESLHLVEFGILYILLFLALLTFHGVSRKENWLLILISSLYGLTDEIHQYFVPYRSATMIDLVKDVIGVLVASWIFYGAYTKKRFPKLRSLLDKLEGKENPI